jgi:hypothetical protein
MLPRIVGTATHQTSWVGSTAVPNLNGAGTNGTGCKVADQTEPAFRLAVTVVTKAKLAMPLVEAEHPVISDG